MSIGTEPERNLTTRYSDRRHPSTAEVVAVITLIFQLAALVWGAATLKASVDGLQTLAGQMSGDIRIVQTDIGTMKVDIGILKAEGKK